MLQSWCNAIDTQERLRAPIVAVALAWGSCGAWVTDRYLLLPVVTRDAQGRRVLGARFSLAF